MLSSSNDLVFKNFLVFSSSKSPECFEIPRCPLFSMLVSMFNKVSQKSSDTNPDNHSHEDKTEAKKEKKDNKSSLEVKKIKKVSKK